MRLAQTVPWGPCEKLAAHELLPSDLVLSHQSKPLAKRYLEDCVERDVYFFAISCTKEKIQLGHVFCKVNCWLRRCTINVLLKMQHMALMSVHFHSLFS